MITDTLTKETRAIAVEKVKNVYKIVVRQTTILKNGENTESSILYVIYDISLEGIFDPSSALFRTELELNELQFGQDINGDSSIQEGPTVEADTVTTGVVVTGDTENAEEDIVLDP